MPPQKERFVTHHVVVTFDRRNDALVIHGATEMSSAEAAAARAKALGRVYAGAVAFSQTGDPTTTEFGEVEVIVSVGEVALELLVGGD